MTSGVFSGCKLSLSKPHIFFILTQPTWDGYLLLYSPKSSIRGTTTIYPSSKQSGSIHTYKTKKMGKDGGGVRPS
jgi:hypothetical protein